MDDETTITVGAPPVGDIGFLLPEPEHCCPYCGQLIAYDWTEESYLCEPCGKKFGDWLGSAELLCDEAG
jgi:DNA-directed RNA polymerase subunit RPC12/RpoP